MNQVEVPIRAAKVIEDEARPILCKPRHVRFFIGRVFARRESNNHDFRTMPRKSDRKNQTPDRTASF